MFNQIISIAWDTLGLQKLFWTCLLFQNVCQSSGYQSSVQFSYRCVELNQYIAWYIGLLHDITIAVFNPMKCLCQVLNATFKLGWVLAIHYFTFGLIFLKKSQVLPFKFAVMSQSQDASLVHILVFKVHKTHFLLQISTFYKYVNIMG